MAITLSQAARDALTAGHLVHMATVNPDGSPHLSVVWVGLEGDEIVSGHLHENQKVRNVRRDPRVTLSLLMGLPSSDIGVSCGERFRCLSLED